MRAFSRVPSPARTGPAPATVALRPRPFGEPEPFRSGPTADAESHGFRFEAVKVPASAPVQRAPLAASLTALSRAPVQRVKNAKKAAGGKAFSEKTKKAIFAANRDKDGFYNCERCGFQHKQKTYFKLEDDTASKVPKVTGSKKIKRAKVGDGCFHIDHVKHKSKGGEGTPDNGRVLCGTCNTSRGDKNRIKKTGKVKYAGLHRGDRMQVMKKSVYETVKKIYDRYKGRRPMIGPLVNKAVKKRNKQNVKKA